MVTKPDVCTAVAQRTQEYQQQGRHEVDNAFISAWSTLFLRMTGAHTYRDLAEIRFTRLTLSSKRLGLQPAKTPFNFHTIPCTFRSCGASDGTDFHARMRILLVSVIRAGRDLFHSTFNASILLWRGCTVNMQRPQRRRQSPRRF